MQQTPAARCCCCPASRAVIRAMLLGLLIGTLIFAGRALSAPAANEKKDETPVEKPPAGAVMIFDGKNLGNWKAVAGGDPRWTILADQAAFEVKPGTGDIITKDAFKGDYTLHVEFMPPAMPDETGQAKGNSGIFVGNSYEIQVLDSFGIDKPALGDCAAIYGKKAPDKNAAKPPAQWQTYDIEFTAPKFDDNGKKIANARFTITWNGVKVHDNAEIDGPCAGGQAETREGGPVRLQDHGNLVRFRNIWILKATK